MHFIRTNIDGVFIVKTTQFKDSRGYFSETFRHDLLENLTQRQLSFVQENESLSSYGVIRGLHFQVGLHSQAKLVRVTSGSALDVAVDLRPGSLTYGKHISVVLSDSNNTQLFIPEGFAHGFACLSEKCLFSYKVTSLYNKESERGIRFDDPTLNIDWQIPKSDLIISEKDSLLPYVNTFAWSNEATT